MGATDLVETFTGQIAHLKEAVRAILLSDKNISGATESMDADVAAAITSAFERYAPEFRYDEQSNTADGKFKVDSALRIVCAEIVSEAAEASEHIMQYRVAGALLPSAPQLLDLARYLSHILLVDNVLFLGLITDLVETCTIDEGTDIFLYLERSVPYMKNKFNFEPQASGPKLSVLRICNMLLRRLSRARHVLLAGRIHLFLSQILPSTDRSAVNANGMVNDSHAIEIEDVQEGFLGTDGKPVDVALYKQFWSLQLVFQNPVKATDPNLWLQVHASIKAVLAEFGKVKPTVVSGAINSGSTGGEGEPEGLTVKFLSSPKLLNLQLRDAGFRRHFLVQCLILLQACSRKSLARQDTFRIKQQGEADDLQELLYKELERTPQHGPQFSRAVRGLMGHEDQWADWKAEGAKSFERPAGELRTGPSQAKRRRLNSTDTVMMGTRELTRLWNITADNAIAIQKEGGHRKHMPSLREFLEPVVAEMDPEDGIEEQYKRKNVPVYSWEALRQISKVSRVKLSAIVRTLNLEEAIRLIFPADVPSAAAKSAEDADTLTDDAMLGAPPSPGPGLLAAAGKTSSRDLEDGDAPVDGPASVPIDAGGSPAASEMKSDPTPGPVEPERSRTAEIENGIAANKEEEDVDSAEGPKPDVPSSAAEAEVKMEPSAEEEVQTLQTAAPS